MAVAVRQRTGAQRHRQGIAGRIDMQAARLDAADGARAFQQATHEGALVGDEQRADILAAQVLGGLVEQGLRRADGTHDAKAGVDFDEEVGGRQGKGYIAVPLGL